MARYRYTALDPGGQEVEGVLEADGKRDAVSILRQREFIPLLIKTAKGGGGISDIQIYPRASLKDLAIFCKQYASLLQAGVPPVQGLYTLVNQTNNYSLRQALQRVYHLVQDGHSLSQGMLKQEGNFPTILIRTVESGEWSGDLETSFERMADYFERQYKIKQKVRRALTYPALLIVTSIIIIAFLMHIVVPQFVTLFKSSQAQLPKSTRILMGFYNISVHNTWIFLVFPASFYLMVKALLSHKGSRVFLDRILLKMPLLGKLNIKIISARFHRTMAILISAGLPITQSLAISSKVADNAFVMSKLQQAIGMVYQGRGLAKSLVALDVFPLETVNIIAIGEESGKIGEMMDKIADLCELEAETALDRFVSLLEPLSILFLGGIIAYIVISVVLPMFQMYVF